MKICNFVQLQLIGSVLVYRLILNVTVQAAGIIVSHTIKLATYFG